MSAENQYDGESATTQDDYVSRTGQKDVVPVQSDNDNVEDPIDAETADSDAQLGQFFLHKSLRHCRCTDIASAESEKDDVNAIDSGNIIEDRTRGAAKGQGTYTEPGDEEGLGGPDDGRSRVAGGPN